MGLRSYVIARALLALPMTLFLLSFVFVILRILPGDPVNIIIGPYGSSEMRAKLAHDLGLDLPLYMQYLNYIGGIFQGQLGNSLHTRVPVTTEIAQFFPNTVELAIAGLLVSLLIGIPVGVFTSQRRGKSADMIGRVFGVVIYVIPVFWLGMMFQLFFGVYLHILPVAGIGEIPDQRFTGFYIIDFLLAGDFEGLFDSVRHLVMPSLTLGLVISGVFLRLTRTYMVETLRQDYTLAAITRGLKKSTVVYRYGLRNALLPLITMIGLEVAGLLAGTVLTEVTFSWPGLGTYLIHRIGHRDYTAVQGAIVFFAVIVIISSFIVDLVYAYLDPRVRL